MRVISKKALREFWERYPDSEQPLKAWHAEAKSAIWGAPIDIKNKYGTASFVSNNRVVFNIAGNKYRLVVAIRYDLGIVYIRFVGNHTEYNSIDATLI